MSDSLTAKLEPPSVCDCDQWVRSACEGEAVHNDHEGKRYCVLHFPGKEKAADFENALKRKLKNKDFNFRGAWFPGRLSFHKFDFDGDVDFSSAKFNAAADFSSATFSGAADFSSSKFSARLDFRGATFSAATDFRGATFSADASFTSFSAAKFSTAASFSGATFSAAASFSEATFSAAADFSEATFSAASYFSEATFSVADFSGATFSGEMDFSGATFSGEVDFSGATFNAEADFSSTTFCAAAYFSSATFSAAASFGFATFSAAAYFNEATFSAAAYFGSAIFSSAAYFSAATFSAAAHFSNATLGSYFKFAGAESNRVFSEASSLSLQHARIEKPERCSFHTLSLWPHWFVNVDARKFEFINVKWQFSTNREIKDLSLPMENTIWYSGEYGLGSSTHQLLAIAFRHLAVNAEENHRYEEASKFRYMAMDVRRRELWHGLAFWRLSWWYWLASGYGERVSQAVLVLLGILLLSTMLYTYVGFARWEPKLASEGDVASAKKDDVGAPLNFGRALTYSAAVMTFQKPEPRPATPAAQTVVLLETILGPVQAALLALAIRRKFMR